MSEHLTGARSRPTVRKKQSPRRFLVRSSRVHRILELVKRITGPSGPNYSIPTETEETEMRMPDWLKPWYLDSETFRWRIYFWGIWPIWIEDLDS